MNNSHKEGETLYAVIFIVVTCWVPQEDSDMRFNIRIFIRLCLGINTRSKKEKETRMGRDSTAASADSMG